MAGGNAAESSNSSNPTRLRKRVEVDKNSSSSNTSTSTLLRAKDGSAFTRWDDFRKAFKEENPDCKSVSMVAKEGGEKWKSMTEEDEEDSPEKEVKEEIVVDDE
ncbi:hypothetical protein ACH5RR_036810 [Cinchona calisaya]|uniref:HMG box domain-containing protein n=1 Tax=Cinchona calisaya TaxID=153742 RepID=A0ABD2Y6L6_9GENT